MCIHLCLFIFICKKCVTWFLPAVLKSRWQALLFLLGHARTSCWSAPAGFRLIAVNAHVCAPAVAEPFRSQGREFLAILRGTTILAFILCSRYHCISSPALLRHVLLFSSLFLEWAMVTSDAGSLCPLLPEYLIVNLLLLGYMEALVYFLNVGQCCHSDFLSTQGNG